MTCTAEVAGSLWLEVVALLGAPIVVSAASHIQQATSVRPAAAAAPAHAATAAAGRPIVRILFRFSLFRVPTLRLSRLFRTKRIMPPARLGVLAERQTCQSAPSCALWALRYVS